MYKKKKKPHLCKHRNAKLTLQKEIYQNNMAQVRYFGESTSEKTQLHKVIITI
jgi:hypothetical protein